MKFLVCIKQVPDVASPIYVRDGALVTDAARFVLNAYDASALEAALVLTEMHGGDVHLVLVGPARSGETIRKALAMGADGAVHLGIDATLDARACAGVLVDYVRNETFDVIVCGKQAQDTDAGLTGSMLAELLQIPYVANAVGLEVEAGRIVVTRQGDVGQEIVLLDPPCLVTCSNDMNNPRIPSLKGIMQAKRMTIDVRPVVLPPVPPDARTHVVRYEPAPLRRPGRILEGDDAVTELVHLLKNESGVL